MTSVLRPVIVTAGVCAAALASIPAAHADSVGDAMAPVLNGVGIGNNGPVSGAIAQMGQSICPMLVKPGGSLASNAAQISGHGGLAPPMAGFLASMAIQAECPGFMTSVANGNMPFPIPGASGPGYRSAYLGRRRRVRNRCCPASTLPVGNQRLSQVSRRALTWSTVSRKAGASRRYPFSRGRAATVSDRDHRRTR